ncbi:FABP family protein [Brachybacterium hainanense]|uniref:FABP family protein n=1 Tax=Brachybacterium hainanense TaxID=1541174 RepID=A0ABV6RAX2_9MICO
MPITLDPSLPEPLYPLAWIVGRWDGFGAIQLTDEDGTGQSRRIEQTISAEPTAEGTLTWVARTEMIDTAAPLPPTSAFAREDADGAPEAAPGTGQRTLLAKERATWRVLDPLPGQDLERARAAKPGDPAGIISYGLEMTVHREDGAEVWIGEVRGPRIQLALRTAPDARAADGSLHATRMFGYVGGRLMWLWERATDPSAPGELSPYLSVELDRA